MSDSSWYPSKVPVPAQVMETMNKMKLWGKGTYNNVIIYTYYILIILYYIICIYYIYIDPFLPWCHTSIKIWAQICGQGCSLALGSRIRCIAGQSSPPAKCYSAQECGLVAMESRVNRLLLSCQCCRVLGVVNLSIALNTTPVVIPVNDRWSVGCFDNS